MTCAARASQRRVPAAAAPLARRAALPLLCLVAVAVFAARYPGIEGDARIYMVQAMAANDPAGLGHDLMVALDGQAAFSLFNPLAARLVAQIGPDRAAMALALAGHALWLTGMALLLRRFVRGPAFGLLFVCAMVLPCPYGFYPLMGAREMVAVPRPFAEGLVLAALALSDARRIWAALGLVGVAGLLHPIMTMPGLALILLLQGLGDRRWLAGAGLAAGALLAAALCGAPLAARLLQPIDPAWRAILADRNPYLFVAAWPVESLAPLGVQVATLGLAALLGEGSWRRLLLAALAIGLSGAAVSLILGDAAGLVLSLQAQPWRALWLVAVLAMPALGFCALRLPARGAAGQIALALLAFAWIGFDAMPAAPLAATLALLLVWLARRRPIGIGRPFVIAIALLLVATGLALRAREALSAVESWRALPEALRPDPLGLLWQTGLAPLLLVPLAGLYARRPDWPLASPVVGLAACLCATLAVLGFDGRSVSARGIEPARHDAGLVARLAPRPGAILWLGSDAVWSWAGRPQWLSFTQGAGAVFSRPLALAFRSRSERLVAAGLLDPGMLHPWQAPPHLLVPRLTPEAEAAVCSAPDAPAWIAVPLPAGAAAPRGGGAILWRAPAVQALGGLTGAGWHWQAFDAYAIIACARRGSDAADVKDLPQ